jgi:hypothetical protein
MSSSQRTSGGSGSIILTFAISCALSVAAPHISHAETYWSLKVWGINGEHGFASRLSAEECLCQAARMLGHETDLECASPEWEAQFEVVAAFLCEAYEQGSSPFARDIPGVE